jgi:hypothetical protein
MKNFFDDVIELPIKFYVPTTGDMLEFYNENHIEPPESELKDDILFVCVKHIAAFNRDSEGNTTLLMSGGDLYKIQLPFEEFLERISKY